MKYYLMLVKGPAGEGVNPAYVNSITANVYRAQNAVLAEKEITEERYLETVKELTHPEKISP